MGFGGTVSVRSEMVHFRFLRAHQELTGPMECVRVPFENKWAKHEKLSLGEGRSAGGPFYDLSCPVARALAALLNISGALTITLVSSVFFCPFSQVSSVVFISDVRGHHQASAGNEEATEAGTVKR